MERLALGSLLTCATILIASHAAANPISICNPGATTLPSAQTVEVSFEVMTSAVGGSLRVYRAVDGTSPLDPNTAVLVKNLTASDGVDSSADMGSGVTQTKKYTVQETCVPKGKWEYGLFVVKAEDASPQSVYCMTKAEVTGADAQCTSPEGGTGGSGGSAGGGGSAGSGGVAGSDGIGGGGTGGESGGGSGGTAGQDAGTAGGPTAGAAGSAPTDSGGGGGCAVSSASYGAGAAFCALLFALGAVRLRRRR